MLSAFSKGGVEFLVVGAYALSAHGYTRATGDIDLFVRPEKQNAERVMRALRSFGAPLHGLTIRDLCDRETVLQLGVPPFRIDVLTGISGVTFDEAWASRVAAKLGGVQVHVLSLEALAQNKAAAGRPKDALDLEIIRGFLKQRATPSKTPPKPKRVPPRRKS